MQSDALRLRSGLYCFYGGFDKENRLQRLDVEAQLAGSNPIVQVSVATNSARYL